MQARYKKTAVSSRLACEPNSASDSEQARRLNCGHSQCKRAQLHQNGARKMFEHLVRSSYLSPGMTQIDPDGINFTFLTQFDVLTVA